ncbi:MAG: protein kinase [Micrococcales bacterium]|nr:protein kinase [Micrococcales bacterium]
MLTGDVLSQWLQRRVGTVVYGTRVQLSPSGLLRVSDRLDSHPVQIALPVVYGGQAAVARAVVDGVDQALALRVQAVSSQAEQARQMERLVSMLTVAQVARADPAAYPAVLPVLESFVVTAPGDEMAQTSPSERYELWCDLMPWCPTSLADQQRQTGPAAPGVALARLLPVVTTVAAVHRNLGIIHRDITPHNVLVDAAGRLLLADWGVAHVIAADQTSTYTEQVGNQGFCLPPEMLAGDTAVGRYTDTWYLGCLLVWMLTGQAPGPQYGPTWLPPGLPGGPAGQHLAELVRGLCWPDPHQRTDLADAAARLFRLGGAGPADWVGPAAGGGYRTADYSAAAGGPSTVSPHTLPSQPPTSVLAPVREPDPRRPRAGIAALITALVVAVVALAGTLVWVTRPDPAADAPTGPATSATSSRTTGPDPACWIDVVGGCPPFNGSAMSYTVFKGRKDRTEPMCYEATRPGMTATTAAMCGWEDADIWVTITLFSDIDTMTSYYRDTLDSAPSTDAPPFVDGPDGLTFFTPGLDLSSAAYCFAELPMCLEATGSTDRISEITQYFTAISPAEAHRIVEYLADR